MSATTNNVPHRSPLAATCDEPLVVSPRRARRLLDCGNTRLYELLNDKKLDSFLDGRSRKITLESIRRYIARKLAPIETAAVQSQSRRRRGRPAKLDNARAVR